MDVLRLTSKSIEAETICKQWSEYFHHFNWSKDLFAKALSLLTRSTDWSQLMRKLHTHRRHHLSLFYITSYTFPQINIGLQHFSTPFYFLKMSRSFPSKCKMMKWELKKDGLVGRDETFQGVHSLLWSRNKVAMDRCWAGSRFLFLTHTQERQTIPTKGWLSSSNKQE